MTRPEIRWYFIHNDELYHFSTWEADAVKVQPSDPGYAAGWQEARDHERELEATRLHVEQILAETEAMIHRLNGGALQ